MVTPTGNVNGIPTPAQPLVDPETGIIANVWFKFLAKLGVGNVGGGIVTRSY